MKEIFRKCSLTLYCIKRYHYKLHQSDRSIYFITAKKTSYKQLKINYKPSEIIQSSIYNALIYYTLSLYRYCCY